LRQYLLIQQDKLDAYKEAKKFAKKNRVCAFCQTALFDLRRMYCSTSHRRKFWQKYQFFIDWRTIRNRALRRDNWLCVECARKGKYVRAKEVHHVIEIVDGGDEFDVNNTESLCHRCHQSKTRQNRVLRKAKSKI
jgi:hypothetical protein